MSAQHGRSNACVPLPSAHGFALDARAADLDGYETTRRLREDPDLRQLKIVALTASAVQGTRERCLEAGMECVHILIYLAMIGLMLAQRLPRQTRPAERSRSHGPQASPPSHGRRIRRRLISLDTTHPPIFPTFTPVSPLYHSMAVVLVSVHLPLLSVCVKSRFEEDWAVIDRKPKMS